MSFPHQENGSRWPRIDWTVNIGQIGFAVVFFGTVLVGYVELRDDVSDHEKRLVAVERGDRDKALEDRMATSESDRRVIAEKLATVTAIQAGVLRQIDVMERGLATDLYNIGAVERSINELRGSNHAVPFAPKR